MRIILLLISLSIAYTFSTIQIYADQLQINSDSIRLKNESLSPLPPQRSEKITIPIVDNTKVLEDTSASILSLSISPDTLLFDPLTPTNPLLRNTTITIAGAPSFLFIYQTQLLQTKQKTTIPPTSCDSGVCDQTNADTWKNSLTFGFGFRCENIDTHSCDKKFTDPYKYIDIQQSASGRGSELLDSINNKRMTAELIYKMNIAATQQAGMYTSVIRYVLMPKL